MSKWYNKLVSLMYNFFIIIIILKPWPMSVIDFKYLVLTILDTRILCRVRKTLLL